MAEKSSHLAIVVSSHDKASDLWEPFCYLADKFWASCPYRMYMITNFKNAPERPYLETIKVGTDKHWASNLKKALTYIDAEYVLYMQDDYLLDQPVNQQLLQMGIDFMINNKGAYLRLMPSPRPDINIHNGRPHSKLFGQISKQAKFRVCLQAGIWKKNVLEALLVDGESGWDMEYKGTLRSQAISEPFFSFRGGKINKHENLAISYFYIEPIENCFFTAVNQGFWLYEAIKFLQSNGYNPYPTKRLVCSADELFAKPYKFYFGKKRLYYSLNHNYIIQEVLMAMRRTKIRI